MPQDIVGVAGLEVEGTLLGKYLNLMKPLFWTVIKAGKWMKQPKEFHVGMA